MRAIAAVLTFVAALATADAASATEARLSAARSITPAHTNIYEPALALNAGGRTLAVWSAQGRANRGLEVRLGRVGGGWKPIQRITPAGQSPVAAVGADGIAAVGWCGSGVRHQVHVAITKSGGPFGKPLTVPANPISTLGGVEVQPSGRVVAIWYYPLPEEKNVPVQESVDYSLLEPGAHSWRSGVIAAASWPEGVSVAQGGSGTVLVAFRIKSTAGEVAGVSTLSDAATSFSTPQTTPAEKPEGEVGDVVALAGPHAEGLVASSAFIAGPLFQAATLDADGTLGEPIAMPETAPESALGDLLWHRAIAGALPADGAQVIAWESVHMSSFEGPVVESDIVASTEPSGAAAFGPIEKIANNPGQTDELRLTVAGATTIATWIKRSSCGDRPFYAIRPANSSFAAARPLPGLDCQRRSVATPFEELTTASAGSYAIVGLLRHSSLRVTTIED